MFGLDSAFWGYNSGWLILWISFGLVQAWVLRSIAKVFSIYGDNLGSVGREVKYVHISERGNMSLLILIIVCPLTFYDFWNIADGKLKVTFFPPVKSLNPVAYFVAVSLFWPLRWMWCMLFWILLAVASFCYAVYRFGQSLRHPFRKNIPSVASIPTPTKSKKGASTATAP
ncbi:hypothetical protein ACFL08_05025 [Patescibacteria group bacterium]